MSHTTLRLRITRRIASSIMLLTFISFNLVQCKKSLNVSKDVSQQSFNELKNKVSELKSLVKKAEAEKIKNPTKKISEKIQYQILEKIKNISHFLFEQFKFVLDKSDKIISKKAFIATMLFLGPLMFVCSKLFGINFLGKIINKIAGVFLSGGSDVTKNIADAVIEKTPEITEIVINKGQNIAEKIIDTTIEQISKQPKGVVKVAGAYGVFIGGLSFLTTVAVKGGVKLGEGTVFLLAKGVSLTGYGVSKVASGSVTGLQKAFGLSSYLTKKLTFISIDILKNSHATIKIWSTLLPLLSLPRFPGGIVFVEA